MHKPLNRFCIFLFILLIPVLLSLAPLGEVFPTLSRGSAIMDIPRGTSRLAFASNMVSKGFFMDESFLRTIIAFVPRISYGRYRFAMKSSPLRFMDSVIKGRGFVEQRRLTFFEGMNFHQIADKLDKRGIVSSKEFYDAMNKILKTAAFHEKYLISNSASDLEGYLFPDTYYFRVNSSPEEVLDKFLRRFRQVISTFTPAADPEVIYEHLIKASLVEKETGAGEEGVVASVINNRLKRNMRLQVDATILYALLRDGINTNNITHQNKYYESPYNTYKIKGLPPGPICSPGIRSLEAVFLPENTSYLYYVSKNDGTHDFSVSYKEHQKKVNKYQR